MITTLRLIKGHNKVESLQIMLEVIETLEKNYFADETINNKEYNIVIEWLEKYYCEIKNYLLKKGAFNEYKIY